MILMMMMLASMLETRCVTISYHDTVGFPTHDVGDDDHNKDYDDSD